MSRKGRRAIAKEVNPGVPISNPYGYLYVDKATGRTLFQHWPLHSVDDETEAWAEMKKIRKQFNDAVEFVDLNKLWSYLHGPQPD